MEKGTLRIDFDAGDLQAMRAGNPPPDAKVLLDFKVANASLEFLPGVPPLRGIDGAGHVTGRTAIFAVANAALDAGNGRVLTVSDGSFHVADFELKPTPAVVEAKVTGSVEAIGELLSHDALKPYASLLLDSSTLGGQAGGNLEIDMKLGPNTTSADTTLKVNATVTNFTAEKLIGNEKLDAATLTVTFDPSGHRASGQGTMFGAPATISIEKLTGKPAEVSIGLTLDDAIRARQGFGAIPGVSGPIGAKITAPIGAGENLKARIELDLSRAAIEIPGVSKPAGQPGKVAFVLAVNDDGTLLDQIVVDAGTIQARGNVQLGAGLSLIAAKFPQVKLSAGDDMKIDAIKTGEAMKVIVRGTAIDARPFLKALIFNPPAGEGAGPSNGKERNEAGPIKEIEFDVKAGVLSGYNKQIIAGAELRFAKRGDVIKQFTFAGTFGRPADFVQSYRRRAPLPSLISSPRMLDRSCCSSTSTSTWSADGSRSGCVLDRTPLPASFSSTISFCATNLRCAGWWSRALRRWIPRARCKKSTPTRSPSTNCRCVSNATAAVSISAKGPCMARPSD